MYIGMENMNNFQRRNTKLSFQRLNQSNCRNKVKCNIADKLSPISVIPSETSGRSCCLTQSTSLKNLPEVCTAFCRALLENAHAFCYCGGGREEQEVLIQP